MAYKRKEGQGEGQLISAGNGREVIANPPHMEGDEEGRATTANNGLASGADLAPTIARIRYWYRRLCFAEDQRKRSDNALGAFVRLQLGWSKALPTDERERIADEAAALIEAPAGELEDIIRLTLGSIQPFRRYEMRAEKEMIRLAETLPVWTWAKPIKNVGAKSIARIVAEAGDLAAYPKKGHLWKRMGVGLVDGIRQGALPKSAPADLWIKHGYSRTRRAVIWVIGDVLVKGGPYREVYLARKAYEQDKVRAAGLIIAPSAKIPEKRKAEFVGEIVIHRRAQRYMEKRFLRDLRSAWILWSSQRTAGEGKASGDKSITTAVQLPTPRPSINGEDMHGP